ncbi:LON peptidase N-terminal domain and RING finger protein 1 [Hordeum vulgare]|nr:LON peptidase N-terminal domain and RING finger protein 1 [Hordeum vulgare]
MKLQLRAALLAKYLTRAPPPTRSFDGGLSTGTTVPAVVPDAFSTTTQAREAPAVAHHTSPICTEMAPAVTSSTECLTQVYAVSSFAKIHDTATTVHSELALDLIHQEVEQTTTAQATPSIGTRASLYRQGRPPMVTTTNVDPKASMQELDDSPVPSFNTSPPATRKLDHSFCSNVTTPAPTNYSAEFPAHEIDLVNPLITATDAPTSATCPTGVLDHLCDERMRPSYTEQQQGPPPVPVQIFVNNATLFHGIYS